MFDGFCEQEYACIFLVIKGMRSRRFYRFAIRGMSLEEAWNFKRNQQESHPKSLMVPGRNKKSNLLRLERVSVIPFCSITAKKLDITDIYEYRDVVFDS